MPPICIYAVKKLINILEFDIKESPKELWDDIFFKNNQQTVFSTIKFLAYHKDSIETSYLKILNNNELVAQIPVMFKSNDAISHGGATYGGFSQYKKLSKNQCENIFDNFINFLKQKNIVSFSIKIPPKTFVKNSIDDLNNYFMTKMKIKEQEETSFVTLSQQDFSDLDSSSIRRNHKRDIRYFEQNYSSLSEIKRITNKDDLMEYYNILLNNLAKFNKKPTHSFDDLWYLINYLPKSIWIDALIYKGSIISGITNFKLNEYVNYFFYGSNNYFANIKGSMKYLYFKSLASLQAEGYQYIDFGIDSKQNEKANDSLRSFKDGFNVDHENRYLYFLEI